MSLEVVEGHLMLVKRGHRDGIEAQAGGRRAEEHGMIPWSLPC